jgi:hypothetical protein
VTVLELFIEKFAEGGFEFAGVGVHHFEVTVPDEEFVAADAPDQEVADLEFVADWANELELGLCSGQGFKVANHSVI